jgi:hypothetical protein
MHLTLARITSMVKLKLWVFVPSEKENAPYLEKNPRAHKSRLFAGE